MIFVRASDSTLRGIKVEKASRAKLESGDDLVSMWMGRKRHHGRHVPCSPTLNSSYASQVTTPPGSRLQHHFSTLHNTCHDHNTTLVRSSHSECIARRGSSHHRLRQSQLLHESLAMKRRAPLFGIEEIANKISCSTGIRTGPKWQKEKWNIKS